MLIVMDKSTNEEHLAQPLQTNNKQFQNVVTFLTSYNGIFNVTNSNIRIFFTKQLAVEMISFKILFHQVLMESKV